LSVPAFDPFTIDPSYCPLDYAFTVSPSLPAPDVSAITLDSPNRLFTYYSTNLALVNVYVVTVMAMSHLGSDLGYTFDYEVNF